VLSPMLIWAAGDGCPAATFRFTVSSLAATGGGFNRLLPVSPR
jgi:hypothetical protein